MQYVVYGLLGYVGQCKMYGIENCFCVGVWMCIYCFQDGDVWLGYVQVGCLELFGVVWYRGYIR